MEPAVRACVKKISDTSLHTNPSLLRIFGDRRFISQTRAASRGIYAHSYVSMANPRLDPERASVGTPGLPQGDSFDVLQDNIQTLTVRAPERPFVIRKSLQHVIGRIDAFVPANTDPESVEVWSSEGRYDAFTPLWPLADPPSLQDTTSSLWPSESWMMTKLSGAWNVLRRIFWTEGPDTFMRDSATDYG